MKLLTVVKLAVITVLLMAGATLCGFGNVIHAQNAPTLTISMSPTRQHLELQPNASASGEVTVMNDGVVDFAAHVYLTPYWVTEDYDNNDFDTESHWTQIVRWVTFENGENELRFDLAAGERRTVPFTITVPESVPAAGQYAVVDGETIESAEVTGREWQDWYREALVTTSLVIKNAGNTDFEANSHLEVTNIFGKTVYQSEPVIQVILPGTQRVAQLNWTSESLVGVN